MDIIKHTRLEVPGNEKEILLHTCCAPCSSAIIECMLDNGLRPVIYFCNPNIYPREEYEKRKAECVRYARSLKLTVVDRDYDHDGWLGCIQGLEDEPERGERCQKCFDLRLAMTALYGCGHDLKVFTTTLSASRWKNLEQIHAAGRYAVSLFRNMVYWEQNWRKGGLSERRKELIAEHRFYNQTFCGCEFSRRPPNLSGR